MSTTIYATLGASYVKYSKQDVVSTVQERLALYVRRVMDNKGLDYREVAKRSGGAVSHTTVFDVVNQRSKDVKAETLIGLAKGLGSPRDEVIGVAFDTAGSSELTTDEMRLLHSYRGIPRERQVDALTYVGMLFERYGTTPGPEEIGALPLLDAVAGTPRGVAAKNLIANGADSKKKPAKRPKK